MVFPQRYQVSISSSDKIEVNSQLRLTLPPNEEDRGDQVSFWHRFPSKIIAYNEGLYVSSSQVSPTKDVYYNYIQFVSNGKLIIIARHISPPLSLIDLSTGLFLLVLTIGDAL